ncbi:hypothetical protein DV736_g1709, partial [Chaetothyriales sp. CBS 134916]
MERDTELATLTTDLPPGIIAREVSVQRGRIGGVEPLTVQGYSQAVHNFTQLATGAGENHRRLAEILLPLHRMSQAPDATYNPSTRADRVLNYYGFRLHSPEHHPSEPGKNSASFKSTFILDSRLDFPSCRSFHVFDPPARSQSPGQLLFLRGHLSAEWIALIGSKYRVDPEFFSQALDFRSPGDKTNNFATPTLPGMSWNVIRLPLMTVGSRDPMKRDINKDEINDIRTDFGNSYVRNYHVFDETNFALEQSITICLQPASASVGWAALVWSDIGNDDIKHGYLDGPWSAVKKRLRSQHALYFPVIWNKPNTGLYSHKISHEKRRSHDMHIDYGRSMRRELMAQDPFYALHEVFVYSICSERQFLNLVDTKLTKAIDEVCGSEFDCLPTLNYLKEILYYHLKNNRHIASTIKKMESTPWIQSSGGGDDLKHKHRNTIVQGYFEDLAEQSLMLYSRCECAIAALMNRIPITVAQKSISQPERLGRLTFLAFIFVPLSFTTSVFALSIEHTLFQNGLGKQAAAEAVTARPNGFETAKLISDGG